MKILFYAGCSRYRNTLLELPLSTLRQWDIFIKAAIAHGYDVRIAGNMTTPIMMATNPSQNYLRQYWLESTDEENDQFSKKQGYIEYLDRIQKIFDFDMVVLWGDYFENREVSQHLRQQNIPVMFCELACMRHPFPEALFMDPCNVNGDASFRAHIERFKQTPLFDQLENIDPLTIFEFSIHSDKNRGTKDILQRYLLDDAAKQYLMANLDDHKYILCPLQSSDDANITYNSSFEGMEDYVKKLSVIAKDSAYKFVITPHPSYKNKPVSFVYRDYCNAAKIVKQTPNMLWCDNVSTFSLIHSAEAVISINSSSGFEAMIMEKPVFVLGEAVFMPLGNVDPLSTDIIHQLNDPQWVSERISEQKTYVLSTLIMPLILENVQSANYFLDNLEILLQNPSSDQHYKNYWDVLFSLSVERFNNIHKITQTSTTTMNMTKE